MTGSSAVLPLHEGLPGLVLTSLLTGMSRLFRRHSPLLTAVCYSIKAQVSLGGLCTSPSLFFVYFFSVVLSEVALFWYGYVLLWDKVSK